MGIPIEKAGTMRNKPLYNTLLPVLTLLLFLAASWFSSAQIPVNSLPNNAYKAGEKLVYLLYYGPIDGGLATATLEKTSYNGGEVYHARIEAKTIGLAEVLYHIKDIYESYFDPVTGLPYKAIRNIQEGRYRDYDEIYFYRENNTLKSLKKGTISVPEYLHDIVSVLYYFRRSDLSNLKNGDVIKIQTFFGGDLFPVILRYQGKETVKTDLGKIPCLRFAPVTEVGRMFKTEDDMTIWFSDDAMRLPVRVKMNLIVGSVKCDLIEYHNLPATLSKVK